MRFRDVLEHHDYDTIAERLREPAFTAADVDRALSRWESGLDAEDFLALLSDAAAPRLDELADKAQRLTRRHFGDTVALFAPIYLSNTCHSVCTYCGFSFENDIKRRTLSVDEAEREARILLEQGISRVILLTGEDYVATPVAYLAEVTRRLAPLLSWTRIEVYPLAEEEYAELGRAGVSAVIVYQETYDRRRYGEVHLKGRKRRYDDRLDALDRAARGGIRKLSVGALLGLSDAATDAFMVGLHARHLEETYESPEITISLPRMRPAVGFEQVPEVRDEVYTRYLLATRLFLPRANLIISSRESVAYKEHLIPLCITMTSAGANTAPGGYSGGDATEQFDRQDHSSAADTAELLARRRLRVL
ncbi:2-iminoacetate synthase [Minicystis rosea]|nr:2-iminoacetate synthase [Minicystis rosea]